MRQGLLPTHLTPAFKKFQKQKRETQPRLSRCYSFEGFCAAVFPLSHLWPINSAAKNATDVITQEFSHLRVWNVSLFLRPALWHWQTTSAGQTTMSHVLTSRRENSASLYAWEQVHGVHAENHMGRSPWIMFSWWIFFMFGWKRYWLRRLGADELVAELCQRSNTQAHYSNGIQMKPCTSFVPQN